MEHPTASLHIYFDSRLVILVFGTRPLMSRLPVTLGTRCVDPRFASDDQRLHRVCVGALAYPLVSESGHLLAQHGRRLRNPATQPHGSPQCDPHQPCQVLPDAFQRPLCLVEVLCHRASAGVQFVELSKSYTAKTQNITKSFFLSSF